MDLVMKTPSWHELFHARKPQRRLFAQDSAKFSLAIPEQEIDEYYELLEQDSRPLVVLSTMEDLRKRLDKAGLTEPIKIE